MKRTILLAVIAIGVFFAACKKDEQIEKEQPNAKQEVSFAVELVDPSNGGGLKDWDCKLDAAGGLLEPDYAQVTIDGVDYFPLVYRIDGVLYTQNIKLDILPGNESQDYTVSKFLLWDDGGTQGGTLPEADDQIVMGTPEEGSDYAVYVNTEVSFDITVTAFQKAEYSIDVLCFQEAEYTKFGFNWFAINEIVVREQCFFGDICIKQPSAFAGSNYALQSTGLQLDMPAIMELHVKDASGNHVPGSPFTNNTEEADYGVGAPLCIQYPDNLQIDGEVFTVELYILVKWGDTFVFNHFHTWTFSDDETIPAGADGIVEIVLGECNLSDTDLQLAPYQDIPTMANISIGYPGDPGYWDITVNTVSPPGSYELMPGLHFGFCGDVYTTITSPQTFDAYVYPSLYDNEWPAGMPFDLSEIATVNWIFNNLDLFGMDIMNLTSAQGDDLQDAIWYLLNDGYGVPNAIATAAAGQTNFQPLPGGWAAVCFVKDDNPQAHQLLFVVVDP
jgi:hypothetical protein